MSVKKLVYAIRLEHLLLEFLIYLSTDMSGLDLEPWLDSVVKCSMYTNQYSDKQVLVLYLHSAEQQKARLLIYQNLQDCTSSKDMSSLKPSWLIGQDLDLYLDLVVLSKRQHSTTIFLLLYHTLQRIMVQGLLQHQPKTSVLSPRYNQVVKRTGTTSIILDQQLHSDQQPLLMVLMHKATHMLVLDLSLHLVHYSPLVVLQKQSALTHQKLLL